MSGRVREEIYFKALAHRMVGAGESEISRTGHPLETQTVRV